MRTVFFLILWGKSGVKMGERKTQTKGKSKKTKITRAILDFIFGNAQGT